MGEMISVQHAINMFIESVSLARSKNTADTYQFALRAFMVLLTDNKINPHVTPVAELSEDAIGKFAAWLKNHSPATERLYLQAAISFYEYLAAERLQSPNLSRLRLLVRQRSRRTGQRLPQFPREMIESILDYVSKVPLPTEQSGDNIKQNLRMAGASESEKLRLLRDRAFLITLADTGLRVNEACGLRRGDIDWNEARAIIIGKGDKQAVVRFSTRSMQAIKDYLNARSKLDGSAGRALQSLPLFARHDKGAGKKIKPITTATGRNIVNTRAKESLGDEFEGQITPHSFRHYFVTTVLRASGNLKLAQELARHANIAVTQRYAHISDDELDEGYHDIFENRK